MAKNQALRALKHMKAMQLQGSIIRKYENTIAFIERNKRNVSQSGQRSAALDGGPTTPSGNSGAKEEPHP